MILGDTWKYWWRDYKSCFFVKRYLRKYDSSEIKTLRVSRVWWEVDAHPVFDFDCFSKLIKIEKFVPRMIVIDYGHGTSGF